MALFSPSANFRSCPYRHPLRLPLPCLPLSFLYKSRAQLRSFLFRHPCSTLASPSFSSFPSLSNPSCPFSVSSSSSLSHPPCPSSTSSSALCSSPAATSPSCSASSAPSVPLSKHPPPEGPQPVAMPSHAEAASESPSVAVIGGGAAGLVASKYLLEAGLKPTVFERAQTLGGMWGRVTSEKAHAVASKKGHVVASEKGQVVASDEGQAGGAFSDITSQGRPLSMPNHTLAPEGAAEAVSAPVLAPPLRGVPQYSQASIGGGAEMVPLPSKATSALDSAVPSPSAKFAPPGSELDLKFELEFNTNVTVEAREASNAGPNEADEADAASLPGPACWENLRTNASRFCCSFSDHPWPPSSPLFPSQSLLHAYLLSYATKFLGPNLHELVKFGTQVTSLSPAPGGKWRVLTSAPGCPDKEAEFDHVVVASGFFEQPSFPNISGLEDFPGEVMHSARYRSSAPFAGRTVAVVGASYSGIDIAADLATVADRVVHIVTHGFWLIPRIIPEDATSPSSPFLPLDLVFYRRSRRKSASEVLVRDADTRRALNAYFKSLCGDRSDLLSDLLCPDSEDDHPHLGISDDYELCLKAGSIDLVRGRLTRVQGNSLILDDGSSIPGVDAIVLCTGFKPTLPFLSEELIAELGFDDSDLFQPLPLHRSTWHPALPGVAFVGMYRGTYFAGMELQARWAASVFSGALSPPTEEEMREGILEEVRIREQHPRPQLPHSDYVGFCNKLAAELGFRQVEDPDWSSRHDMVLPSQYLCRGAGSSGKLPVVVEAERALQMVYQEFARGRGVPGSVFRALACTWRFRRWIESRGQGLPSGFAEGTATFTPRPRERELWYREDGELVAENGQRNKFWKEYVYACPGPDGELSVFFCDQSKRTYLFHTLEFHPQGSLGEEGRGQHGEESEQLEDPAETLVPRGWCAQGEHKCGEDLYLARYRFAFRGLRLLSFSVVYEVLGPNKRYTSSTLFEH